LQVIKENGEVVVAPVRHPAKCVDWTMVLLFC